MCLPCALYQTAVNTLSQLILRGKIASIQMKLESSVAQSMCLPCALYQTAVNTLSQLRLDILGGKIASIKIKLKSLVSK